MRFSMIAAVVLVIGCEANTHLNQSKNAAKPLTEEDRIRWKKIRRKMPDYIDKHFQCIARFSGSWKSISFVNDSFRYDDDLPKQIEEGKTYYVHQTRQEAEECAKTLCREPNVSCVAVVDLYSKESPQVSCWYRDDGNGAKKYSNATSDKFRKELADFLLNLQRKAN